MIEVFNALEKNIKENKYSVLVTIIDTIGSTPGKTGFKMLADAEGRIAGTVGGGSLEFYAIGKCKELIEADKNNLTESLLLRESLENEIKNEVIVKDSKKVEINAICGGEVTLFYEVYKPVKSVHIFGAGHVGKAVARIAKFSKYYVTLIDDREDILEEADSSIYDKCEIVTFSNLSEFSSCKVEISKECFALVVTRNHVNDLNVLEYLYKHYPDLHYIGLIGSKKKVKESVELIRKRLGHSIKFDNLYAPVGLAIGGDSPEEIALGVMAEILAISNNKNAIHNKAIPINE